MISNQHFFFHLSSHVCLLQIYRSQLTPIKTWKTSIIGCLRCLNVWGYITPEIAGKFPGYLSPSAGLKFADVPNGLAAISKVLLEGHVFVSGVLWVQRYHGMAVISVSGLETQVLLLEVWWEWVCMSMSRTCDICKPNTAKIRLFLVGQT